MLSSWKRQRGLGRPPALIILACALLLVIGSPTPLKADAPPLVQLSADPYANPSSQHRTQVEPDTFAYGSTIVAAFQSGRFDGPGASNIAWATSWDGGANWTQGHLPGITLFEGGPYTRASDPSVAYTARDNAWLISSLTFTGTLGTTYAAVVVSRSTNGGTAWGAPAQVVSGGWPDKNWTVCDNTPSSVYYGRCYTEWASGGALRVSTSLDGGLTWGAATGPLTPTGGFGGQPVVQPNGVVVVPFAAGSQIRAFRSLDGGATWSSSVLVAPLVQHGVAGNLRVLQAASAEVDAAGTIYLAWHDCSFRLGCYANDIVISSSPDGLSWSPPRRVPVGDTSSGLDLFIPGLGVDATTAGTSARLGLAFYYYPVADCYAATCQLNAGFIASADGGATWGAPARLAGPFCLGWLPRTTQGAMVGDYISTSFANGIAYPAFAVAQPPHDGLFDQAIYTLQGGFNLFAPPTSPLTSSADMAPCPTIFMPLQAASG